MARGGGGTQLTRTPRGRSAAEPAPLDSRRRFARRQWARRWLAWRPLLAGFLVLAAVVGAIYAVYFSERLSVAEVAVVGVGELSEEQVRETADVPLGGPLATADLDAIELRVRSLARVSDVEVTRRWPDTVAVTVQEREPIAVVSIGGRLRALDVEGVVFDSYRRAPSGLPRIETSIGTGSEALAEVATVVVALPSSLRVLVEDVGVETVDTISLNLRDGRTVRWGSAERSAEKARVLGALLQQEATTYDVSVPEQPTISG